VDTGEDAVDLLISTNLPNFALKYGNSRENNRPTALLGVGVFSILRVHVSFHDCFVGMYRQRVLLACVLLVPAVSIGCSNLMRREQTPATISLEPPPGVAAPAHTLPQTLPSLPQTPSYSSLGNAQLEAALTRSQTENQIMQEELSAIREQLASTTTQLAASRVVGRPGASGDIISPMVSPAAAGAAAAMQSAMGQLSLDNLQVRLDGGVVRVEVPSERLFESGTPNLLPAGASLLTQLATELETVFPRHYLGIEGHLDTDPLTGSSWQSAHQLTTAQASTVFDFLTTRTPLSDRQMFLVAHGSNHPVVSNATTAGRQRNCRIECVIYPEQASVPGTQ
jgi:flagellar motor protein MotB